MAIEVYSIVVAGRLGVQPVANVSYYRGETDNALNPVEAATALITAWIETFHDLYLDCLPTAYGMTSIKCKRVTTPGGPVVAKVMNPGEDVGTRTGDVSTTAEGPVLLMQGNNTARYVSGKWFLPGVSETDVTLNTFSPTLVTAVEAFGTALLAEFPVGDLSDFAYCIFKRVVKTQIVPTLRKISLKPGTQRRRLVPII